MDDDEKRCRLGRCFRDSHPYFRVKSAIETIWAKGIALVTVRVQGGLGNQLFQAAAGYYLSRFNNQNRLILDVTRIPFGTDPTRRLEIEQFDLFPSDFHASIEGNGVAQFARFFPKKIGSFIIEGFSWMSNALSDNKGEVFIDDKNPKSLDSLGTDSILHGYFNNFDVVAKAESLGFSRNLKLRFGPSKWLSDYISDLNFEEAVALHIRLGDYLRFPQIFGNLSENFYLNCLEHLEVGEKQNIVIFSDQPNKVANLLPKISKRPQTYIFREPPIAASFETFYLMSKFKKICCANSTFSMWAAWFNDEAGNSKQVTVPSPYLLNEGDMVTPGSWIKVPRFN